MDNRVAGCQPPAGATPLLTPPPSPPGKGLLCKLICSNHFQRFWSMHRSAFDSCDFKLGKAEKQRTRKLLRSCTAALDVFGSVMGKKTGMDAASKQSCLPSGPCRARKGCLLLDPTPFLQDLIYSGPATPINQPMCACCVMGPAPDTRRRPEEVLRDLPHFQRRPEEVLWALSGKLCTPMQTVSLRPVLVPYTAVFVYPFCTPEAFLKRGGGKMRIPFWSYHFRIHPMDPFTNKVWANLKQCSFSCKKQSISPKIQLTLTQCMW